ncbi:MAG: DUF1801 domain-containing protein [Schleiferiaceae bacterium]|jgi:uncharacterized protein YdeI (YjbR/CyaY-like superfamily)|nr:DUF1801 domain-containing protein [Schleiferiaceae bacterium]
MEFNVDSFLVVGCGRCSKGGTLKCNARIWGDILKELRRIILECGLEEKVKWSHPWYAYNNNDVLFLGAFNGYASLGFVKGSSLEDQENLFNQEMDENLLDRKIHFTHVSQVLKQEDKLKNYIIAAVALEKGAES